MDAEWSVANLLPAPEKLIKEERNTVVWITKLSGGERIVIKLYRHRGFLNALRSFVSKHRTRREYEFLGHLEAHRVTCTPARGWTHGYSPEHGFFEVLATELVDDAVDLEVLLEQGGRCDLRLLFEEIRRMHECGFCHHALFVRNVLIVGADTANPLFAICDVPRSRIFPKSIVGTRMALFDVVDLAADMIRRGVPEDSIPFDAYGFTEEEQERLSHMLENYRRDKIHRRLRDGESRVRHLLARIAG